MTRATDILPYTDDFDPGNPKGWALGWLFPIADALYLHEGCSGIPDEWEYRPTPALDRLRQNYVSGFAAADAYAEDAEEWQPSEVVSALRWHGPDALRYVGKILVRYMNMFERGADQDY